MIFGPFYHAMHKQAFIQCAIGDLKFLPVRKTLVQFSVDRNTRSDAERCDLLILAARDDQICGGERLPISPAAVISSG